MPRWTLAALKPRFSSQSLSRLSTQLVLLILVAIALSLLVGFVEMTWASHRISREIAEQREQNSVTAAHVAALKGEAEFRESNVYAEQAAREQLGMARDGEIVLKPTVLGRYASPPPSAAPKPSPRPAAAVVSTIDDVTPNHERWWQAFFPAN